MLQGGREHTAVQRKTLVYTLVASVFLALAAPAAHTLTAQGRLAHAARPADRVTACVQMFGQAPRM